MLFTVIHSSRGVSNEIHPWVCSRTRVPFFCGAYPIEFRHEGTGSGTLGGTPFSAQPFLIRGFGDTSNRQLAGADVFFIDHDLATIDLGGNTLHLYRGHPNLRE